MAPRQAFFVGPIALIALFGTKMVFLGQNSNFWRQNPKFDSPRASRVKISTQKVPFCLILTTFWDAITFGHITQLLGTDFEETHFYQRHPVVFAFQRVFVILRTEPVINVDVCQFKS